MTIMVPRLAMYGAASTVLAGAVVGSAVRNRANFFAAAVTVGKSSGSLMVLANFALFNVICFGILLKKLFFGQLRSIEYEHLSERLWLFLTESLLALTIFRDDFSIPFAIMYSLLLFLKCFHWISADRVDYMDQVPPPGPPLLFHVRIVSILSLLITFDMLLVSYSLGSVSAQGLSSMVLFASEYTILLASVAGTWARYFVGLNDLRRARGRADAPSWEEKSMYLFYIDLAVDFVKLLTYLVFFSVIFLNFGLPLHILRDVYMTLRSFISRCSDLIRYRRATRDMDAQYPNATAEEMRLLADKTCIICREEMVAQGEEGGQAQSTDGPNETPKKLACGHIFHFHCLRSWLERQQSCPTCRRDVLQNAAPTRRAAPPVPPIPAHPQPGQAAPPPNGLADPGDHPAFTTWIPPTQPSAPQGASATSPTTPENSSERIQTGIWGGPIRPGQFFPTPLGAGPSRSQHLPMRIPSPLPTPTAHPAMAPMTNNGATAQGEVEVTYTSHASAAPSGFTTPFSSNPPQVFSPTGTHRRLRSGSSSSEATAEAGLGAADLDEEDQYPEPPELSEADRRRAAAEAAMRRLGLKAGLSASASNGPPISTKGKEKAVEPVPSVLPPPLAEPEDAQDAGPKFTPYLTPMNGPTPSASIPLAATGRPWQTNMPAVRVAEDVLEDRLRVLRDVDEDLWVLIERLVQAKSRWEIEDSSRAVEHGDGRPA